MATSEDVQKLSTLARISVPEGDLARFASEFDAIINYVSQLEELTVEKGGALLPYTNVFLPDENPHKKGVFTEKIAAQFPAREGDALSVKQIISHD